MRSLIHSTLYWSKIIALGVILGIGIQFAHAWTNPTLPPPGGNVSGPLNTGIVSQIKQSSLGLLGNLAANMLQINEVVTENTACSPTGLVARDSGGVLLSCQGGLWKKATGGGVQFCKYHDSCGKTPGAPGYDGACFDAASGKTLSLLRTGPYSGVAFFSGRWTATVPGDSSPEGSPTPVTHECTGGALFF